MTLSVSFFVPIVVKSLGSEFILGYIQAMDGEQDPRNLTIVFPTVLIIVKNLPIGKLFLLSLYLSLSLSLSPPLSFSLSHLGCTLSFYYFVCSFRDTC